MRPWRPASRRVVINFELLVTTWGYPALLVGAFLEGETIILIGGFLAGRGYLELGWVMLCAFIGSLLGDQFAFFLGRRYGRSVVVNRPWLRVRAAKVQRWMRRRGLVVLLGFRFVYGFRNIVPFTLGSSGFSPGRFAFWNVIGAAIWAVVFPTLGFLFGEALTALVADIRRVEHWIVIGVFVAAGIYALVVWLRRPREVPAEGTNGQGG